MAPEIYHYDPDEQPDDQESPYPYQNYYGTGSSGGDGKQGKGSHGGWWILVILAVVVAGVIGLFSRFTVNVRQTGNGMTLSIQDASTSEVSDADETAEPQQESVVLQPSAETTDSGTKLHVTKAPQEMPATPVGNGEGLSLQEIYQKVIPSVVSITSTQVSGVSSGTGIIMSEDGYVITNEHVIDGAVAIEVLTSDDAVYSASIVGSDATSDLAVLKIEEEGLTPAEFGDSEQMQVGDSVAAIGDPLGKELRGTMTDGIISAINRDLVVNGRSMTLMQTNAALNEGNSGGPLINAYGQVIGINTMKLSSYYSSSATVEGLGFAIPIATAKPIIDELIEQGFVSGRPALGIKGLELPDAVQTYYRVPDGIYIESIDSSSDAYQKGIRVGDTITAIEGVAVETMDDLNAVKNQYQAGDLVELTIFRGGEWYRVQVELMDASGM